MEQRRARERDRRTRVNEGPTGEGWEGPGQSDRTARTGEGAFVQPARRALPTHKEAARQPDWRSVLAAASPREVLARLMSGDPLRLAAVVEERLRARAYLFDADRVLLRTAARCARLAGRYRGDPPLERWLAERADEALLDLLRADAESDLRGEPPGPERLAAFEVLARPLGLDPTRMHRACMAHNQLPESQRRAFREVVIEGRSLDVLAARGGRSATEIARGARAALRTLLVALEPEESP